MGAKEKLSSKKRQRYITDKRAALDREYATTDRPKHHLLNEPLTVAPPTFVHAGRAHKVPLVPEVESGQCRPIPDEGEKLHKKSRLRYMTCKWHQMHHEQHPSYILP